MHTAALVKATNKTRSAKLLKKKQHKQVHIPARISTAQLDLEESLQTPSMSPFNLEEIGAIAQWGSQVLGRAQNNYCLIPRRSASIQSEQYSGSFPIYQDLVLGLHMDYLQLKKNGVCCGHCINVCNLQFANCLNLH